MEKFVISGGKPLYGSVRMRGAKNAVLPLIAASVLVRGVTVLRDVPRLSDVEDLLSVMGGLGCVYQWHYKGDKIDLHIDTTNMIACEFDPAVATKIRATTFLVGSMYGRFGTVTLPSTGGCDIGARPIDLHISGLRKIGARVRQTCDSVTWRKVKPPQGEVFLDFPSVGATLNLVMASVIGNRSVRLVNVAKEPEIVDVCNFLNGIGAIVMGAGTDTIIVDGVEKFCSAADYTPIPDRINTGTYMLMVAMTGGDVTIENARPSHNEILISKMREAGIKIKTTSGSIRVQHTSSAPAGGKIVTGRAKRHKNAAVLQTGVYPGFSTDLQAQFAVFAALGKGAMYLTENLYENRFRYSSEVPLFGGDMSQLSSRILRIQGVEKFEAGTEDNPVEVFATDLRAGASLVMCALAACGVTHVKNAGVVARGYYGIVDDLRGLGAEIDLVDDSDGH